MDISGINNKINRNTVENAKNKVVDSNFEKNLQSAMDKNDEKELKKVCKDFESVLLNMMYKEMKATVPKTGLLPDDIGKDVFDSMLDDKLVEDASKGKGMGLGDMLFKQLSRQMKNKYKPVTGGETEIAEDKKK